MGCIVPPPPRSTRNPKIKQCIYCGREQKVEEHVCFGCGSTKFINVKNRTENTGPK